MGNLQLAAAPARWWYRQKIHTSDDVIYYIHLWVLSYCSFHKGACLFIYFYALVGISANWVGCCERERRFRSTSTSTTARPSTTPNAAITRRIMNKNNISIKVTTSLSVFKIDAHVSMLCFWLQHHLVTYQCERPSGQLATVCLLVCAIDTIRSLHIYIIVIVIMVAGARRSLHHFRVIDKSRP